MVSREEDLVLSNLPASRAQQQLALIVALLIVLPALLISATGMQHVKLAAVDALVPLYGMAMFVTDSITAALLFTQFSIAGSRALLVISCGYVWTALVVIPWLLSFPGVFAPSGLLGGNSSEITVWLYALWHAGFPIFVIGYALLKNAESTQRLRRFSAIPAILSSIGITAAVISAATYFLVAYQTHLPSFMLDRLNFTVLWYYAASIIALLTALAIVLLWLRWKSLLDLWLMVVMLVFMTEVLISSFPVSARFSLGWYVGRACSLLSGSLILFVLLYEITMIYARLIGAVRGQSRERGARLITGDAVAATIAHEIKQPLSAIITRAETGLRWLDRPTPEFDRAKGQFAEIAADGRRAVEVMDGIRANFKNDTRLRTWLDVNALIEETLTLVQAELQQNRIFVRTESNGELPQVIGDRTQLQQVLLNLITNAIEAMAAKEGLRTLGVRSDVNENGGVAVSIADTGRGIKPQEIEQIFNPLFTTKPDGMGMGLFICRSIVESHGGNLLVFPNSPQGVVFQMVLHAGTPASA
ncbi:MASE4 domain-containing protein [Bradyrhizobium sp. CB1650]|uniref:MASE4 domain-containing protein n=1 Tax=Bradyrhizobium sp. CB1650 TaxID=3039153 RepID=UPI0024356134|nr:MASE4 domain-containing protein [Bradyrhizobium sp. CB1650]WGD55182.1 MASE4 domain-containing protein [Bradyrhizobium sp. CB1650]